MSMYLNIQPTSIISDLNGSKSKVKRNSNVTDIFDYEFGEEKGKEWISFKAVISDSILKAYQKQFSNF